jgi:hypothetical protein
MMIIQSSHNHTFHVSMQQKKCNIVMRRKEPEARGRAMCAVLELLVRGGAKTCAAVAWILDGG